MANEKHLYVTASGTYVATGMTTETWQVGVRYYAAPGGTPDPVGTLSNAWDVVPLNTARTETNWDISGNWTVEGGANDLDVGDWLNDQLCPAFVTWLNDLGVVSNAANLTEVKVYPIGTDGKAIPAPPFADGTPITATFKGTLPGGSSSSPLLPLQISAVASHRTAQTGRRGRGRMFIPALTTAAMGSGATNGQFLGTAVSSMLAAQVALLESTQLDVPGAGFWCLPAIIGNPWTQYALINQVRVGNIPDTQRRRRRALLETFSSTTVDNPA